MNDRLNTLLDRSAPRVTRQQEGLVQFTLQQLAEESHRSTTTTPARRGSRLKWFAGAAGLLIVLGGGTAAAAATPSGRDAATAVALSVAGAPATESCEATVAFAPGHNAANPAAWKTFLDAQKWLQQHPAAPAASAPQSSAPVATSMPEARARAQQELARDRSSLPAHGKPVADQLSAALRAAGDNPSLIIDTGLQACAEVSK